MEAWRRPNCDLPDDEKLLARLAGLTVPEWQTISPVVMELWVRDGRRKVWTQKRLSKERDYVGLKSASQRDKAAKRWHKAENQDATALPNVCRSDAPTPTPTPTPNISSNDDIDTRGKPKRSTKWSTIPRPDSVNPKTWEDFEKHRKAKGAPITETAIKGFEREAAKAGLSLEGAITESIERNWQGFKADWIKGAGNGNGNRNGGDSRNGLLDAALGEMAERGRSIR
jgi:uncharacterized protein YdaU (DUF1376 family)